VIAGPFLFIFLQRRGDVSQASAGARAPFLALSPAMTIAGACRLFSVTLVLGAAACRPSSGSEAPAGSTSEVNLSAVVWLQTAAEFEALALQAFAQATAALDQALVEPSWVAAPEQTSAPEGAPPAVILDVDETVLDNSPYQGWLLRSGERFAPTSWGAWVEAAAAEAVPGALAFTKAAAARGVTVFYVSNRDVSGEAATRQNLARLGFPLAEEVDVVLLKGEREDWGSAKGTRRAEVASRYRIVMLVGDNLGDFTDEYKGDVAARAKVIEATAPWWGSRWIMIPNPMYGSWESALGEGEPAATLRSGLKAWRGPE
jgi:5'-nucleotidase (lipoprotein e(P4) family)